MRLKAHTADVTYGNWRGGDDGDLASLVLDVLPGAQLLAEFPKATITTRELVDNVDANTLDVHLTLGFAQTSDFGLLAYDDAGAYRVCAPAGMVITSSNATWRDTDGCVIWKHGASVLRLHAEHQKQSAEPSLLDKYRAWLAAGKLPLREGT